MSERVIWVEHPWPAPNTATAWAYAQLAQGQPCQLWLGKSAASIALPVAASAVEQIVPVREEGMPERLSGESVECLLTFHSGAEGLSAAAQARSQGALGQWVAHLSADPVRDSSGQLLAIDERRELADALAKADQIVVASAALELVLRADLQELGVELAPVSVRASQEFALVLGQAPGQALGAGDWQGQGTGAGQALGDQVGELTRSLLVLETEQSAPVVGDLVRALNRIVSAGVAAPISRVQVLSSRAEAAELLLADLPSSIAVEVTALQDLRQISQRAAQASFVITGVHTQAEHCPALGWSPWTSTAPDAGAVAAAAIEAESEGAAVAVAESGGPGSGTRVPDGLVLGPAEGPDVTTAWRNATALAQALLRGR